MKAVEEDVVAVVEEASDQVAAGEDLTGLAAAVVTDEAVLIVSRVVDRNMMTKFGVASELYKIVLLDSPQVYLLHTYRALICPTVASLVACEVSIAEISKPRFCQTVSNGCDWYTL